MAFISASSSTSTGATLPLVMPTLSNGKDQYAIICWGFAQTTTGATPAGWTPAPVQPGDAATSLRTRFYYKQVGAADSGATVNLVGSASNRQAAFVVVHDDVDAAALADAANWAYAIYTSGTGARATPTLTRTFAGPVASFFVERSGTAVGVFTAPASTVLRTANVALAGSAGSVSGAAASTSTSISSGACPSETWDQNVDGSTIGVTALLALKPAAGSSAQAFRNVDAAGWSSMGGTLTGVLNDVSDTTYIASPGNPTASAVDLRLAAIEKPVDDFVVTVRAARHNASRASIAATLRTADGAQVPGTGTVTVTPAASAGDLKITFPAAWIDTALSEAQWRSGNLFVRLAVTATV